MKASRPALQRLWQKGLPGVLEENLRMLWTITIVLFILWLLGVVSGYTLGSWIHILLVLAVIVLIFNLLSGRRAL
jgi:Flp pilus assembly protein TadB